MNMAASDLMLRLSESEFQQMIIDRARVLGWLDYHTHDSRRSTAGFPDLVLARDGRVLIIEAKTEKGRLSKAQAVWLRELGIANQLPRSHEVYLWRPSDMAHIVEILA